MRTKLSLPGILAAALLLAPANGWAKHPKLAKDLDESRSGSVDVIVQYKSAVDAGKHDKVKAKGGTLKRELKHIRAGAYSVRADGLEQLAGDPDVEYISPDRPVSGSMDLVNATVGSPTVWNYGFDGAGVTVAVLDSGYSATPDLDARIVYQQSFIDKDGIDSYGHGTHVLGIVGGNGAKSSGLVKGIAPGARLVNLKVLDGKGRGTDSGVIAAIQRAIDLKAKYNIRVLNLSLGRPVAESYRVDPLCRAVEAAWRAGIVVVVAAGNDGRDDSFKNAGYGTINSPANSPYVITVGAMKPMATANRGDDLIASYSSKGPTLVDHIAKPDLVAPGNLVVAANGKAAQYLAGISSAKTGNSNYIRLSGTSMASAVVSGGVALMLQKEPELSPDLVKARLMKTASKALPASSVAYDSKLKKSFTSYYDLFTVGAGYLDLRAALNNADRLPAGFSALSPAVVFAADKNGFVLSESPLAGTDILWGTDIVWGTNVFVSGSSLVWGTNAPWASQSSRAFDILWGTASPYASSTSSGTAAEAESILVNGEN